MIFEGPFQLNCSVLFYAMLCYAMLYCAMLCYAVNSLKRSIPTLKGWETPPSSWPADHQHKQSYVLTTDGHCQNTSVFHKALQIFKELTEYHRKSCQLWPRVLRSACCWLWATGGIFSAPVFSWGQSNEQHSNDMWMTHWQSCGSQSAASRLW